MALTKDELADIAHAVWSFKNDKYSKQQVYSHMLGQTRSLDALRVENAAQSAAIKALAGAKGIDPEPIIAALREVAESAFEDLSITLTTPKKE